MATRLADDVFDRRLAAVRDRIASADADAGVWFDATSIEYLTGFHHIQTERPVALAVTDAAIELTVPRLEVTRVAEHPRIEAVHAYRDYPGGKPIATIGSMLEGLGITALAADAEGAPGVMGYEGPPLEEVADVEVDTQAWVPRMRWEKSDEEVALIRESARWANLGHRYLAEHSEPGAHPVTVSQRASMEASRAMLDTLGEEYAVRTRGTGPVTAGFIAGEETRLPHGHTANERLTAGDVLITGATANLDGYYAELERTMFVGEPDDEQAHYFELMREGQARAIDALGPGVEIAEIDRIVTAYFEEQGVADLADHHVGHNIGMDGHEPPYIDRGWTEHCRSEDTDLEPADAKMQPGHVWTIEPGLYTEEYGYRHSDTVAITEDGAERLTYFPRDLEDNIVWPA